MDKIKKKILLLVLFSLQISVFAQKNLDSLFVQLQFTIKTEEKIEILFKIANQYYSVLRDINNAEKYLIEAKTIAYRAENKNLIVNTLNELGVLYRNSSRYSEALSHHKEAYRLALELNSKKLIAKTLNSIGVVYRRLDDHSKAAEYHLNALRIAEEIKDTFNISVSYNSLGNIYSVNGRYEEALVYFNKALELSRLQKNLLGQAINYNNIGEVYEFSKNYEKAKEFYTKSLEINKTINSEKGISICYNALGKILLFTGYPRSAYKYFSDAAVIDKKIGDKKFIADSYINLGRALVQLKRIQEARQCIIQGISLAQQIKSKVHLQLAYEELSNIFRENGDFKQALYYYQKATVYKDSVLNEKNSRHISTIQALFETEKKEKEIQILKQNQEIKEKEFKKQLIFNYSLLIGLLLSVAMITVVYIAFVSKRKANWLLSKQKEEIEKQNEQIENQNINIEIKNNNLEEAYVIIENYIEKITDSIRYAEQIQKAIFPDVKTENTKFKDTFVFYKPKDIVSGDFYWYLEKEGKVFIALADCTGHGVPGAFMSIIGIDLLNQAMNLSDYNKTENVLSYLNNELREKLQKDKNEVILKDSMDIAFCIIDLSKRELTYSGALIPVFIVNNGEVSEIKPNYTSLGTSTTLFNKDFNTHTIILDQDTWIYISTDGYFDQFGGEKNKKFMRSRFVQLILDINKYSAVRQKEELEAQFIRWKGQNEQIDDVLVWGFKV
ncbi:MAG: tetratricopeptide repeat protein [Tenuifilaceae bacterium]